MRMKSSFLALLFAFAVVTPVTTGPPLPHQLVNSKSSSVTLEHCVKQVLEGLGEGDASLTVVGSSVTLLFKTNPQSADSTGDAIINGVCGCGAGTYSVTGEDDSIRT